MIAFPIGESSHFVLEKIHVLTRVLVANTVMFFLHICASDVFLIGLVKDQSFTCYDSKIYLLFYQIARRIRNRRFKCTSGTSTSNVLYCLDIYFQRNLRLAQSLNDQSSHHKTKSKLKVKSKTHLTSDKDMAGKRNITWAFDSTKRSNRINGLIYARTHNY